MTSWSFAPAEDGTGWVVRLGAGERAVLLDAVDQVVELLGGPGTASPPPDGAHPLDAVRLDALPLRVPQDPALLRLLPDASPDPAVAAEFRRLSEQDLRATKVGQLLRLRSVVEAGRPEVLVVPSEADLVAAALTDLRLVVSERLGLRTDKDADAVYALAATGADGDPVHLLAAVYAALTELQDSLVQHLLDGLDDRG